ncbi:hypothetical protein [Nannocystis pusilla]|uniref:hypothetical protein n=1 Tax=Nannocystis pusilla TaxID=889268 RepID=UPI003DA1CE31
MIAGTRLAAAVLLFTVTPRSAPGLACLLFAAAASASFVAPRPAPTLARTVLAAATLLLLAFPRPAQACSRPYQSQFDLFDRATRVAEVRVEQTPGRREAGMARLRVLRTLKGSARATLAGEETNTSCHVGYRTGRRAVVFLGPRGETLAYHERPASDPQVLALRAFVAAEDPDARVRVLVDAIAAGPAALKDEAAWYLANRPELLARIDLPARERLLAAAEPRDQPLLVVLARLELDFPAPPPSHYRHYYAELAALLRPRDELDDLGVEALAGQVERGREGYDPQRIRAMDRCERQTGHMLSPVLRYGHGSSAHFWTELARSCRTGEPAKH